MEAVQAFILQLWRGEAPLWVAFWVYGQGIYAVLMATYFAMYKFGMEILAPLREKLAESTSPLVPVVQGLATMVNVVDAVAFGLFTMLWFVAVWRCAPNTDWVVWEYAARTFVLGVGLLLVLGAWIWWRG